ncbi:hypothetical protein [Archangium sp.]|jgi:hypothetical protein|uniref:hypothetical protein n=1 Tax=Archangium sp. TaxID=1872627 RepID=UPI002ED78E16
MTATTSQLAEKESSRRREEAVRAVIAWLGEGPTCTVRTAGYHGAHRSKDTPS